MANINAQFNYSANFGPVIGQMQKLTAEANLLNNTLQNLDKQAVGLKTSLAASFASDLGKIGGWNAKMIELTDSVDQFGQSLLKQKLTLKEYAKEAIGAFTQSSNAHKLAVREVAREMSQLVTLGKGMDGKQMGMMITPATINLKDFNTQMAVSQKQWSIFNSLVQDGTTHLINFGKNTQWAGRQITVGLTVPLTIYGNTVSKIFREVDAELTRFQKVYGSSLMSTSSDTTRQMVDDVRSIAIEFSKSFGIAAKETASLAADLAATGLEGQKLLASLRETTRLAVLGDVSNQDAMKTTLSLQNAFKMSTDELAQSVNFLNAVENQTSLSLQDLTAAIPKAGPVVKALGGDVKDLSLLMVALKEGGISAAEGANALKSGMASLINPTKQAANTAKQYGIDINTIVQANRGQLLPTIIEFQRQLSLLDEFSKAQVIEQVFGKYQFARMSALFDNLNASASQTNAVLQLMGKSNKELAATAYQEMDTLMNSASKRFERATEGIKAQFISIGESITTSITPIIESITNKIGKAIEFFQNLPKPIKSFIKVAVGLTAVAGPIIMMVGIFSNFLGYIGKGAMGMVNLGRRMAGLPTQKFEMLSDTQIMAARATEQLSNSFNTETASVQRLNQALSLYRQNLVEAINLNPAFLNRQTSAVTTSGNPPTVKLQGGGKAWVPGSGNGDKVPAMLEPGEYVVNKKAAAKYSGALDQMNFQSAPRFQNGGRMPGYADESFIGPKPQISYNVQGTYRPGGYTPFANYPFASKESAESFQSTDPRKWGGSGSRITRDINDPQQKAYADWIAGHNSEQFRTGTGVMKRLDMEGHRNQMLNSMGPISQSIPLYRGTVLKEKGANEFSGVGARELLMYIKYGMFDKAMGKKIQWSDMQSFSSNPNIASYNKFIQSWTNPSNTNSKKAVDRKLQSMEMLPVIFRLASAQGQNGFNISDKAMVQEVMGKPVNEQEWVLNSPSGTITGIRQDIGTKNYIVDLMQNGGRVQSHADRSFPGVPTVKVDPNRLIGMGGVNSEDDRNISGLDRQSGMFYKQISNNRGLNTNAMIAEAVFSQLYRSGLFGSNVTGIDQRLYNANTGNKTMPVLGSTFIQGLKTGDKLFDNQSRQINAPTPFAKGVVSKKAIEAMLAAQILGNADTHSGNFGLSGGKIAMLDNTANLLTDANGNQRRTSKALNDFSYSPDRAGLDRAGTQAYGKMGAKKADSHVIGYLNSVLGNLNSGNYIAQSINLATQGSPELLKNINEYAVKKSGGASKSYQELLTSMISMRTQKLMQEFYVDEDNLTLVDEDTSKMRLQSNAEESYREPFKKTDAEYETVYKWIGGELDYFRRRKNVKGRWTDSEKFDAERYQQLLSIMRSVPEGTKMMRGSILNPGMSGEMSKEAQLAMLTAIQTGDYGSLYGMDISFNDFASFASDAMGPEYGPRGMKGGVSRFSQVAYNKLYRGVHSRDTESGRFFDNIERQRATGKESKYGSSPVMYDFTAGPNTQGRDISMGDPSTGAPYPKYRDSWVSDVPDAINEILTYRPQGTITGVSSDLATRQPIIHMQGKQMGGRINGYATKSLTEKSVSDFDKVHLYTKGRTFPKDRVSEDWTAAYENAYKVAQSRISVANEIGRDYGISNAGQIEVSHTRSNPYSSIFGAKAKEWDGSEILDVKLINGLMNYFEKDNKFKSFNHPDTKAEATVFKSYLESISKNKNSEKYKNSSTLKWVLAANEFLGNQSMFNYYGQKPLRLNEFSDKKLSKFATVSRESTPDKIKEKIRKESKMLQSKQSGGRINGYATETSAWKNKAGAPKAYAGVLQGIPNWATKPAEYEAIVTALRAAGIPESDRLASIYIQDVLAHINPSTTNANGVYEKVWAAANLMKDSQVYNVFLETLNSRKDIGGLLNPSTVSRVAAASGLPVSVVQTELTKMADGVHPNTANGARVMMTLARMFPSRTKPGMPIAVAAGLEARLQGNFYDTLGQRALPSNLPNVTVRSYDPKGTGAPTSTGQGSRVRSTGLVIPSGAIRPSIVMPNVQSISSAAGGMGTSATVKVDGMGNVLSNGIDDMVAHTVTGQPIAVSSKELLAISSGGLIAGVTSPGDEARGNIVHPVGTSLMRGKKFQQARVNNFAEKNYRFANHNQSQKNKTNKDYTADASPVYDQPISGGSMGQFGGNAFMMISVMQQMSFAISQFTTETQNGTGKLVAGMNLFLTATQAMSGQVGEVAGAMAKAREASGNIGPGGVPLDNRGKEITKMSSSIGKAVGTLGKGMSLLGSMPAQIGLQVAIMAVTKGIEMYQKAMEKARLAGNGAFKEPTETAKLLGIELKSLTADTERYAKFAATVFGSQGRGAYDKVFAETIKKDYADYLDLLSKIKTKQEQVNQLTNVYASLIQRGVSGKDALDITAEVARQGQAISALNEAMKNFSLNNTVGEAMDMQIESLIKNTEILNSRKKSYVASGLSPLQILNFIDNQKIGNQLASQIGATLKSAFSIAAQDPVASNEAINAIVDNFEKADMSKVSTEIGKIAEEAGFGDLSNIGTFLDTGAFTKMGAEGQKLFLTALQSGLGAELDKMLADGTLSPEERSALEQKALEAQALMKIDVQVDLQIDETVKQLGAVQDELNKVYEIALRGKQEEITAEDLRHEKAMKNLNNESQRLNDKKDLLQRNTDYYLKELEREKQAEDYYAGQRDTALQGLTAISQGDVFGFIGAQMRAASQSDQFGRDRSLTAIKETSDAAQQKLDDELKAIDRRRQAEDERHTAEINNINSEIEALNKKKAAAGGQMQEAIKLLEEAKALQPSTNPQDLKIYNDKIAKAMQLAGTSIDTAKAAAGFVDKTGLSKDLQTEMDNAQKKTKVALDAFYADTDTAMQYIANGGEKGWDLLLAGMSEASNKIFNDVAKSLNIDDKSGRFIDGVNEFALAANFIGQAINSGMIVTRVDSNGNLVTGNVGTIKNRISSNSNNAVLRQASGGYISGPGSATSDSIPAMLSNGEYVVSAAAVKAYGPELMDRINAKRFANGGAVGDYSKVSYRGKTFNGRTAKMLQQAENAYGSGFNFYQGSYSSGVKASMGTHDGGGAVDIVPPRNIDKALKALSLAGFWAKWRGSMKPPHIHALAIGDKELSNSARRQLGLPADKSYKNVSQRNLKSKDSIGSILPLDKAITANTLMDNVENPPVSKILDMFRIGRYAESFANGGGVFGAGSSTSDSIPAMLSNGEYVINASAVKTYGPQFMDKINTKKFAVGGMVGSMPAMSSAPGFAGGGSVPMPTISAPSTPTYNVPSAGGGMSPSPIAQMARGGMMNASSSDNSASYNFNFNGAGMDMVMSHVNKAVGGRINSNSRRIG